MIKATKPFTQYRVKSMSRTTRGAISSSASMISNNGLFDTPTIPFSSMDHRNTIRGSRNLSIQRPHQKARETWSSELSFSSPESDFTATNVGAATQSVFPTGGSYVFSPQIEQEMLVKSPETALGFFHRSEMSVPNEDVDFLVRGVESQSSLQSRSSSVEPEIPLDMRLPAPESALGWRTSQEVAASDEQEIAAVNRLVFESQDPLPSVEETFPLEMRLASPESALGWFNLQEVLGPEEKEIEAVQRLAAAEGRTPLPSAEEAIPQHMRLACPESALGWTSAKEMLISDDEKEREAIQRLASELQDPLSSVVDEEVIPHNMRLASPETALGWTSTAELLASDEKEIEAVQRLALVEAQDTPAPVEEEAIPLAMRLSSPESAALGWTTNMVQLLASDPKEVEAVQRLAPEDQGALLPPIEEAISLEMQWASPESALGWTSVSEMLGSDEEESRRARRIVMDSIIPPLVEQEMPVELRYASPESALGWMSATEQMSAQGVEELTNQVKVNAALEKQVLEKEDVSVLVPRTVQEALVDPRPIVITEMEAPFKVVSVNEVWEGLCGYSREEALEKPIGALLQGPETNRKVTNKLIRELMNKRDQQVQARILNYTKDGRKFHNRVKVGRLYNEDNSATHFVGVLEELEFSSSSKTAEMMN